MSEATHILVVEARFYENISDALVAGAITELEARGATFEKVTVPGALEIPLAIRLAIKSFDVVGGRRRYDGYVALGCVIRGETSHYDIVANQSARGLMNVGLEFSIAVGNGILTCETMEQATERAAVDRGNKGGLAVRAALDLVAIKGHFGMHPR